jgi:hypothetical protein
VEHRRATYLKIGCRNGEKTFKPNMPLPKEGLVVSDRYIRGLGTELDRAGLRWPPEMLQGTSNVGWVDKLTSDHSKSWCETNQMRSIGGSSISVVKEGDRDKTPLRAELDRSSDGLTPAFEWRATEGLLEDPQNMIKMLEPTS